MDKNIMVSKIELYDRIYLSDYDPCKYKYLLEKDGQFYPSNDVDMSRSVILEKSISGSGYWVVVKVGNEISKNLE